MSRTPEPGAPSRRLWLNVNDLTRELNARPALAFSHDGAKFSFAAPTIEGLGPGRFVVIAVPRPHGSLQLLGADRSRPRSAQFEGLQATGSGTTSAGELEVTRMANSLFQSAGPDSQRDAVAEGQILSWEKEPKPWGNPDGPFDDSEIRLATADEVRRWLYRNEEGDGKKKGDRFLTVGHPGVGSAARWPACGSWRRGSAGTRSSAASRARARPAPSGR